MMMISVLALLPTLSFAAAEPANRKSEVAAKIASVADAETTCLENPDNSSTVGMKECMGLAFEGYDNILNDEYKVIVADLKKPAEDEYDQKANAEILKRLVKSQRAWIKYRDENSSFASIQMLGGTGEGIIYMGKINGMTKARIIEIIDTIYGDI